MLAGVAALVYSMARRNSPFYRMPRMTAAADAFSNVPTGDPVS
jgi:hypothetical protein